MGPLRSVGARRTTYGFAFEWRGRRYKRKGFLAADLAAEAERHLRRALAEHAFEGEYGALPPRPSPLTPWADAVARYEAAKAGTRSLAADRPRLAWWGHFIIARLPGLQALTPTLIDTGKQALVAEGKTPGTVRNYLSTLRAVCRIAVAEHWLRTNPVAAVEIPTAEDREPRVPTLAERRRLFQAARREPLPVRVAILTALLTGLREASIAGLRAEDLRERPGFLRATAKGRRTLWLPVSPILARALRALGVRTGPLFVGARGRPWGRRIPERAWTRLRARAGLPWLHFHDLRHTAGTDLSDAGIPARWIQLLLGHASLEMTQKYLRGRAPGLVAATRTLDRRHRHLAALVFPSPGHPRSHPRSRSDRKERRRRVSRAAAPGAGPSAGRRPA